jgi:hypothetical protein
VIRSGVLKISGAFLAGLVVALGSALLYVRLQDREPSRAAKVEQVHIPEPEPEEQPVPASELPAVQPPAQPVSRPPATAQPAPAQVSTPKPNPIKHVKKSLPVRPRTVERPSAPAPVQVVQNSPASSVPVYPSIGQQKEQSAESSAAATPPVAPAPEEQPHEVQLAAGTALTIRLGETVSTEHNYTGDTFRGTLDQPLIRDGFIIADRGSKVLGKIVDATQAGRVKGTANLILALTEINTTDGQRIRVATNTVEKRGTASSGSDAAKIAGGAALGAIIGALGGGGKGAAIGAGAGGAAGTGIVLATRGKPATLPNESLLTFQLSDPVVITEKLNH